MGKFVKSFKQFSKIAKPTETENVNEGASQVADTFYVSGVPVKNSFINSYVKKVKDETGINLRDMKSTADIAEELVKGLFSNLKPEEIAANALLGGDTFKGTSIAGQTDLEDEPVATEVGVDGEVPMEGGNLEAPVSEEPVETDGFEDPLAEVGTESEEVPMGEAPVEGEGEIAPETEEQPLESPEGGEPLSPVEEEPVEEQPATEQPEGETELELPDLEEVPTEEEEEETETEEEPNDNNLEL